MSVPAPPPNTKNSKLITCKDCGGLVSKKAQKCPACGAPVPKSYSGCLIVVIICVVATVVAGMSSTPIVTATPAATEQAKSAPSKGWAKESKKIVMQSSSQWLADYYTEIKGGDVKIVYVLKSKGGVAEAKEAAQLNINLLRTLLNDTQGDESTMYSYTVGIFYGGEVLETGAKAKSGRLFF